jgi:hypothetical protein
MVAVPRSHKKTRLQCPFLSMVFIYLRISCCIIHVLGYVGSAIYVFGDKKNDHGLYSVTLDNRTAEVYNGISGCGGTYGMTCEQMQPTLNYFASNLDNALHSIKIENMAGANSSFFGEQEPPSC